VTLQAPLRPDHATQSRQRALSGVMRRIAITDFLVVAWAVLGAEAIRFGADPVESMLPGSTCDYRAVQPRSNEFCRDCGEVPKK
jgi:hypothetical protein